MIQEYQIAVFAPAGRLREREIIDFIINKRQGHRRQNHGSIRVLKRGIDARQRTIYVNLSVRVYIVKYHRMTNTNMHGL